MLPSGITVLLQSLTACLQAPLKATFQADDETTLPVVMQPIELTSAKEREFRLLMEEVDSELNDSQHSLNFALLHWDELPQFEQLLVRRIMAELRFFVQERGKKQG